ncbi:type II toxin-antitoxin system Phd/YefM family antitoxin [Rhizobium sp. BK376]|uniref:type II toxin-antitoxin system Phd/YefM family antitoxin n=1 Tax=Rhizobium sp. BK376 TaxID=2512149 RepID=UPI001045E3E9|nr:type II toxin-antitoxin system Phd/YefM family antitoxin [Rhizobium sp. BK376]TCR82278.1 antitoxin Phd_YefM of type II toxin-antitoxin system [Rhizobium sp. BK376]
MDRVSILEFQRNVSHWLRKATEGPVEIIGQGKPSAYLLSEQMFRQLWGRRPDSRRSEDGLGEGQSRTPSLPQAANDPRHDLAGVLSGERLAIAHLVTLELELFGSSISQAFIFGSIVEGNVWTGPGVDLVVIGEFDVFDLCEAIARLELALGREINLNIYTPTEWDALSDHSFVINILNGRRIMLIEP